MCSFMQQASLNLVKKVKVKAKAKVIPTAIIFPNSITGLISPIISERKAIAVVNAAKGYVA